MYVCIALTLRARQNFMYVCMYVWLTLVLRSRQDFIGQGLIWGKGPQGCESAWCWMEVISGLENTMNYLVNVYNFTQFNSTMQTSEHEQTVTVLQFKFTVQSPSLPQIV